MGNREFRIKSFRNIGTKDNEPVELKINNSLKKDELGELIILIGPNNSGKSNVLDALLAFDKEEIKQSDINDFYVNSKGALKPTLSFCVYQSDEERYSIVLEDDQRTILKNGKNEENSEDNSSSIKVKREDLTMELNNIKDFYNRNKTTFKSIIYSDEQRTFITNVEQLITKFASNNNGTDKYSLSNLATDYSKVIDQLKSLTESRLKVCFVKPIEASKSLYPIANQILDGKKNNNDIEFKYEEKYDYPLIPRIYKYEEKITKGSDLDISGKDLANSSFFVNLLKILDFNRETLLDVYMDDSNSETNARANERRNYQNILNNKLVNISEEFNKLYFEKTEPYSFEIVLERKDIVLYIKHGQIFVDLDKQSTGFKWFFNLYFNFLSTSNLRPGDIIIMDEPATNLHVRGQEELRQVLKDFARKNSVIIIIATHSPFLVDIDYLDELRIVSTEGGFANIENNFAIPSKEEPDALVAVKSSLTIDRRIILDPSKTLIFVEGITDYNYLTAMKVRLKKDNFVFLPINGLGGYDSKDPDKSKNHIKELIQELVKIRPNNPIILCDGDRAGREVESLSKDEKSELTVLLLSKLLENPKLKEIEDLFSEQDINQYNLKNSDGFVKTKELSSVIKNDIIYKKNAVTKESLDNFKKLFEALERELS